MTIDDINNFKVLKLFYSKEMKYEFPLKTISLFYFHSIAILFQEDLNISNLDVRELILIHASLLILRLLPFAQKSCLKAYR